MIRECDKDMIRLIGVSDARTNRRFVSVNHGIRRRMDLLFRELMYGTEEPSMAEIQMLSATRGAPVFNGLEDWLNNGD